ncbi:MAG: hypothetical protein SO533_00395 [Eubacteriales bacterium]|nr:hypothetical protein [Clostridiales bacterium]MDY4886092.1 hypothetical protein [Eubacteriales bacterium]
MKRIFACVLVCLMLLSAMCVGASAADDIWKDIKFSILTQTASGYNFGDDDIGGLLGHGQYQMRGFAVAADGSYVFGGYLNPGGTSAVEMFDAKTGRLAGTYVHVEKDGASISYPKGMATDDRGYLYVGLASRSNKSFASFAVVKYDEKGSDGWLKEVYREVFIETDDSTKTGINGVAVRELAGRYYMYIIVNYDVDYLYRFDVTDPAAPVLDTTFGDGGRVNLQSSPYKLKEGNYLDVDVDGTIYMGFVSDSDSGLMVLSEDGKKVLNTVSQNKGYAVTVWEGYVIVTSQSSPTCICVYDKASLTLIETIKLTADNVNVSCDSFFFDGVNSLVGVRVVNDVLYVGDQGSGNTGVDQIFMAPLTVVGQPIVDAFVAGISERLKKVETTAPETTKAPVTTAAVTEAEPQQTEPATNAPEVTDAPATSAETTAPAGKSGCGSSAAIGAVALVALLGSAIVIKRK